MESTEKQLRRAMERLDQEHKEKVNARKQAGIWKARAVHLARQLEGLKTRDAAAVAQPDRAHKVIG